MIGNHTIQHHYNFCKLILNLETVSTNSQKIISTQCKSQILTTHTKLQLTDKKDPTELCSCKCHYGGAESCPGCKRNHGIVCSHCKD